MFGAGYASAQDRLFQMHRNRGAVQGRLAKLVGNMSGGAFGSTVQQDIYFRNCDMTVNNFDIDAFVLAVSDPVGYAAAYPTCDVDRADINGDGAVNNFDIDPFVAKLTGG